MLTRIFKNPSNAEFAPLSFSEIGTGQHSAGTAKFVYPNLAAIETLEEIHISQTPAPIVEDVMQDAREQAAAIVAQAEKDKEAIEQAAFEKGLNEAKATIEAEISERVAAKADEMRERMTTTIEEISALAGGIAERVEADVVEFALEIARKVVGREVSLDREIVCAVVKVALGKLHNRSVAEVHLNPDDYAFVQVRREQLGFRGSLELVEDASISVGGCLIHTETGDIDARIESQFDEIAHGLLIK